MSGNLEPIMHVYWKSLVESLAIKKIEKKIKNKKEKKMSLIFKKLSKDYVLI